MSLFECKSCSSWNPKSPHVSCAFVLTITGKAQLVSCTIREFPSEQGLILRGNFRYTPSKEVEDTPLNIMSLKMMRDNNTRYCHSSHAALTWGLLHGVVRGCDCLFAVFFFVPESRSRYSTCPAKVATAAFGRPTTGERIKAKSTCSRSKCCLLAWAIPQGAQIG